MAKIKRMGQYFPVYSEARKVLLLVDPCMCLYSNSYAYLNICYFDFFVLFRQDDRDRRLKSYNSDGAINRAVRNLEPYILKACVFDRFC